MYHQNYDQLLLQLKEGLIHLIAKNPDPLKRLSETLSFIRSLLLMLRKFVFENPFTDQKDEIYFFKHIKPQFYSSLIYESQIYQIMINVPKGTRDNIIDYYEQELRQLHRFFDLNRFYYEYYRCELTEMDHLFFVRGADVPLVGITEVPELDPEYSTALDYIFAKFMAYEQLQDYILEQISLLVKPVPVLPDSGVSDFGLTWTGESINLVELAYGIWLTGQMNNGNASIAQIIRWLEESLHVKIGRPYRRFTEITRREVGDAAKFLDRMSKLVNEYVENDNALHRKVRN